MHRLDPGAVYRAIRRDRQLVYKNDMTRLLEPCKSCCNKFDHKLFVNSMVWPQYTNRLDRFPPFGIRNADHHGFGNRRMLT